MTYNYDYGTIEIRKNCKSQFFDCPRGMNPGLVQGGELRLSPLAIPHCFVHAASRVE
jgi:hypothetical protein